MSRFSHKQILDLWCGNKINLFYRVIPGLQIENFGKSEFYTNYLSSSLYIWSNYLTKKVRNKYHHGCSPFLYAHAMLEEVEQTHDALVFLPKSDIATGFNQDKSKVIFDMFPDETTYVCFPSDTTYWTKLSEDRNNYFKVVSDWPYDPLWNFNLVKLLSHYKKVYLPIFSSSALYAMYCDCEVEFYNCDDVYKNTYPYSLIESYSINESSSEHFLMQKYVRDIVNNKTDLNDQKYLIREFLSPEKRENPESLLKNLYNLNYNSFTKNYSYEDYYENFISSNDTKLMADMLNVVPLKPKEKWVESLEQKCQKYDKIEPSDYLKSLIQKI
jgi:hypothetical protein